MHHTYSDTISANCLMQGDVLRRTDKINQLLSEVHPHFYHQHKNQYFMVLTQTCDLVLRQGKCKAAYVNLAPIRSLDLALERHLNQQDALDIRAETSVRGNKARSKAGEFLQRLLNNNELGYFYLEAKDTRLSENCVAFLNLSLAIKAELHFETCIEAKIVQLTETFQAKLGWLVGQMYSRVGTEDWDTKDLNSRINELLKLAAVWVDDVKLPHIKALYEELRSCQPDAEMSRRQIETAVSRIPSRKQKVMDRAAIIIAETLGSENEKLALKLRRRLENDAVLSSFLNK